MVALRTASWCSQTIVMRGCCKYSTHTRACSRDWRDGPTHIVHTHPSTHSGAVDPNSGTAALLEVAKGLGTLWRLGWRPRRTIVLGSWSGEELGLIGSTHWAESNAQELSRKAVAVLNCDSAVSGPFVRAEYVRLWSLCLFGGVHRQPVRDD